MIELPDMVTISAGRFMMGTVGEDRFANSTERPAHEVVIEKSFMVSHFPITEAQWRTFAGGASSALPVVRVGWWEATRYVEWLSAQTGKPFRLLTDAEWEYACRAGSTTIFSVGDTLEMEASQLYSIAARKGKKALAVLTVSDHVITHEAMDADARERTLNDMVEVALAALSAN